MPLEIYTWRQIANVTPEIEKQVNIAIEYFPGRATRDHWADQGKIFADEKITLCQKLKWRRN